MSPRDVLYLIAGGVLGLLIIGYVLTRRGGVRPSAGPFDREEDRPGGDRDSEDTQYLP